MTEYDIAGAITDTEADALLSAVHRFAVDVEAWIHAHHPEFSSDAYGKVRS